MPSAATMQRGGKSGQHEDPTSIKLLVALSLNTPLRASLRSFFRKIGKSGVYRQQVCRAFDPGPGLAVVARAGFGRGDRRPGPSLQAVIYCFPQVGMGAVASRIYTLPWLLSDVGLSAAVFKTAVEAIGRFGFNVRYVVRAHASLALGALADAGFRESGIRSARDGSVFRVMDANPHVVLEALRLNCPLSAVLAAGANGIRHVPVARFLTALQLAALNEPAEFITPHE